MCVRVALLLTFVGLVAAGCASPQPLPEAPTPIPTLIPATLPAAPMAPLPSGGAVAAVAPSETGVGATDQAADLGRQVFDSSCKACHKLTDEKLVGPGLAGLFERRPQLPSGKPFSDADLIAWIKSGGKAMPGFASLSDEQLDGVIAFLKDATSSVTTPETAPVEGKATAEPAGGAATSTEAVE